MTPGAGSPPEGILLSSSVQFPFQICKSFQLLSSAAGFEHFGLFVALQSIKCACTGEEDADFQHKPHFYAHFSPIPPLQKAMP